MNVSFSGVCVSAEKSRFRLLVAAPEPNNGMHLTGISLALHASR
jgi:hypothetical protein